MIASGEHNKIARLGSPTVETFRNLVSRKRPVIISGATKGWKACSLWSTDYLRSVIGASEVRVEVSRTNYFPSLQEPANIRRTVKRMAFDSYAEIAATGNQGPDKYYLADESLIERFPALAEDIDYPSCLDRSLPIRNSWWFGSADTVTPLHYDIVYNLTAQVCGRKRFTLLAPDQLPLLYPFPALSRFSNFSRVHIEKPDFLEFPKFQRASPLEIILEPGEMLYIPPFWWHQVRSLDMAISLTFWWKLEPTGYLAAPARRLIYPLLIDLMKSFRGG